MCLHGMCVRFFFGGGYAVVVMWVCFVMCWFVFCCCVLWWCVFVCCVQIACMCVLSFVVCVLASDLCGCVAFALRFVSLVLPAFALYKLFCLRACLFLMCCFWCVLGLLDWFGLCLFLFSPCVCLRVLFCALVLKPFFNVLCVLLLCFRWVMFVAFEFNVGCCVCVVCCVAWFVL